MLSAKKPMNIREIILDPKERIANVRPWDRDGVMIVRICVLVMKRQSLERSTFC